MDFLSKLFLRKPWHYAIAVVIAMAAAAFRYFTLPQGLDLGYVVYEALSVSGSVTFLVGALLAVAYFGAFDLFGYVFAPGRTDEGRQFKNYAEYANTKQNKRYRDGYYFVPYFVVGALVFLISFLFA